MRKEIQSGGRERGVMLIEALIAILIFSIGILAVVGMQGVAIKNVTESKYRSEAAFLANELISVMWTDAGALTTANYNYPGSSYGKLVNWVAKVDASLPGTAAFRPKVTITPPPLPVPPAVAPIGATVQIELFWQLPEEASLGLPPRKHLVIASIFTS
jgi:type IV pilus assembly protein PilV